VLRFLIFLSLAQASLFGSHYCTLVSGGTVAPSDPMHEVGRYAIHIHGVDELGEPTFRRDMVTVKGKYDSGHRLTFALGKTFLGRYRAEWESGYTRDHLSLSHISGRDLLSKGEKKWRRCGSVMLNVGGYLFPVSFACPYSMVGVGFRVVCVDKKPATGHVAYQWITGIEFPLGGGFAVVVQHRMHKGLRADALHGVEVGLKVG